MAMHDVGSNLLVSSKEGKKSWGVQTSRGNKRRKLYYSCKSQFYTSYMVSGIAYVGIFKLLRIIFLPFRIIANIQSNKSYDNFGPE